MTLTTETASQNRTFARTASALAFLAFGICLLSVAPAQASSGLLFGYQQTAQTVGDGVYSFGVGASIGDDVTTIQGDLTYGFGMFTEGRIRLGISDFDAPGSDPALSLGAEFKYQFWNFEGEGVADPFDLSFGGMMEYVSFDGFKVTSVGANITGSRPFTSTKGRGYGPYGRLNVRLTTVDLDFVPSTTDIKFSLTPGMFIELTDQMTGFLEFNFDDNTGIGFGFQFGPF